MPYVTRKSSGNLSKMAKSVIWLMGIVFLLAIDWSVAMKESNARTLYVAEKLSNRLLGKQRRDVLSVEWRADEEFVVDETESQGSLLERLARKKRQTGDTPGSGIQKSVVSRRKVTFYLSFKRNLNYHDGPLTSLHACACESYKGLLLHIILTRKASLFGHRR